MVDVIEPTVSRSGIPSKTAYKIATFKKLEMSPEDDDDIDDLIKKPSLTFNAVDDEVTLLVTCKNVTFSKL